MPLLAAVALSCSDPASPAAVTADARSAVPLHSVANAEPSAAVHRSLNAHGFDLTFYPGFASRATVRDTDGTVHELFRQTETYRLADGRTRPDAKHVLRLRGGKHRQDVTLHIDDPELRIARIIVELYDTPHRDDAARTADAKVERFEVRNNPRTCPPDCGPVGGD